MRHSRHRLQQCTAIIVELPAYGPDHFAIAPRAHLPSPVQVLHDILPQPVFMLYQPVDQLLHRSVNARRAIADYFAFELSPQPVDRDKVEDAPQANRIIEETITE